MAHPAVGAADRKRQRARFPAAEMPEQGLHVERIEVFEGVQALGKADHGGCEYAAQHPARRTLHRVEDDVRALPEYVLTGATLQRVGNALQQVFLADTPERRDYAYYTDPLEEPYLARRRECGWGIYGALGIARGDRGKSKAYRARNFNFFGAPVGLVLSIERKLEKGSWLDYGMFLQTIMLAARARGLHTCPEASIANYPDIVRRELGINADWVVICGMALGYADADAAIDTFQLPRIGLDEYATFLD